MICGTETSSGGDSTQRLVLRDGLACHYRVSIRRATRIQKDGAIMALIWNQRRSPAMPVSLSIKNVPDDVARRLRERAARNRRSLQSELLVIVEAAAGEEECVTVDGLLSSGQRRGLTPADEATTIIRASRDGRAVDDGHVVDG
jgi:plasmid stability protein